MRFVVGVFKDELPHLGELALDSIEPGGVRGCPDERNRVCSRPTAYLFAFMGREVVQNQKDALVFRVPCTHPLEHIKSLLPSLAGPEISPEYVLVDVIK